MVANQRRGFTLIELLVVIAIIAILAAILFPVFSQMKEKAKRTACSVHLRQIALAISQYVEDNGGCFPHFAYTDLQVEWAAEIYPYLKSWDIEKCPSAKDDRQTVNGAWQSYGLNRYLATPVAGPGSPISRIRYPSDLVMVGDCAHGAHGYWEDQDLAYLNLGARNDPSHGKMAWRHSGGANIAFVDFHVRYLKPSQITQDYPSKSWDPDWP